jgi:hypothetical protein
VHYSRIVAIVGVIISAVGLFLTSASSTAGDLLKDLSAAAEGIPSGFDSVWTAIYDDKAWAGILLALALLAILAVSVMPPLKAAFGKTIAMAVVAFGVVVIVIGGIATLDAMDSASELQDGFAQLFAGGLIPEAFTVSIGIGWVLLIVGGGVAAVAGVLSLMADSGDAA